MKRNENIKFLKGLLRGERHVSEICPPKVILLCKFSDQNHYTEGQEKKIWSAEDVEKHKKMRPNDRITIIEFCRPKPDTTKR